MSISKQNNDSSNTSTNNHLSRIELDNFFGFLQQETKSPTGIIDKTKALTNALLKDDLLDGLTNSVIGNKKIGMYSLGTDSLHGFIFTAIKNNNEGEAYQSLYARKYRNSQITDLAPGVVTGFLIRKEIDKSRVKKILEAKIFRENGKECTLKFDFTSNNL